MNIRNTKRSETTEQIRVIQWAQHRENEYPVLKWLMHIPNGGKRDSKEAKVLKQLGVKAGVSDLFLPYPTNVFVKEVSEIKPYHGLFIEMKYGKNKTSDDQEQFLYDMAYRGYYVATCYSYNQAIKVIEDYLHGISEKVNNSIWRDEIFGQ